MDCPHCGRPIGKPKRVRRDLSTGEIAALCSVSIQTVIRCIDTGNLPGYRVPGSKVRRAKWASVQKWARENGLEITQEQEAEA